eukprot:TRINITY_DN73108_c0_g1_i1.p1 TRINITY_DN73108_c0_g1~~TRINITY_DN73108_c0_g1_i1.p1  ORF type:complete len:322 (+),score=27.93 TRINITY_DN73108_c0_g1_i1:86-967(+)
MAQKGGQDERPDNVPRVVTGTTATSSYAAPGGGQLSMPGSAVAQGVVMGVPVQGDALRQNNGELPTVVAHAVPVAGAVAGAPVVAHAVPVMGPGGFPLQAVAIGVADPNGLPYTSVVGVVEPELTPDEVVVLNYSFSLKCFTTIDMVSTVFNAISASLVLAGAAKEEVKTETEATRHKLETFGGLDRKVFMVFSLFFLIGPICGMIGANRLQRKLVTVYLVFCIGKTIFDVVIALLTPLIWSIIVALIQVWITKIVVHFWRALGSMSPERCKELLSGGEAPAHNATRPRMVYW